MPTGTLLTADVHQPPSQVLLESLLCFRLEVNANSQLEFSKHLSSMHTDSFCRADVTYQLVSLVYIQSHLCSQLAGICISSLHHPTISWHDV